MNHDERRLQRTDDQSLALSRHFEACRARAKLDALVLADEQGLVVASAAQPDVDVDQIAAHLPTARWSFVMPELRARTLYCDGTPLFVGAIGPSDVAGIELSRAAAGAQRILQAA